MNKLKPLIKLEKLLFYLLIILVVLSVVSSIVTMVSWIQYPYQVEYREGATLDITKLIIKGENPYLLDNMLPHLYVYGVIYSLLVAWISIIDVFLAYPLELHRALSFVFILCTALLGVFEVFKHEKRMNIFIMLAAFGMLVNVTPVAARPEALAVFIFLLMLSQVKNCNTMFKTVLLGMLTVLSFYIKQYFVIAYLPILIILLFKKKKLFFSYLLSVPCLFILSYIFVTIFYPLYFASNITHHLTMTSVGSIDHMLKQSIVFIKRYWPLVLVMIMTIVIDYRNMKKTKLIINKHMNEPFIETESALLKDVYFHTINIVTIALVVKLGHHTGAYMSYYEQMLMAPLVIFVLRKMNSFEFIEYFKKRKYIYFVLCTVILFVSVNNNRLIISTKSMVIDHEIKENWETALNLVETHNPNTVYLSPVFTTQVIENGWAATYDNGQSEFAMTTYSDHKLINLLVPITPKIYDRVISWQNEITNKVKNKEFSLIAVTKRYHPQINYAILSNNYYVHKEIDLNVGAIQTTQFWLPKDNTVVNEYILGETITMNTDEASNYMLFGWSFPESWGVWTDGVKSIMVFHLSEVKEDMALYIDVENILSPEVEVIINDESIGEVNFVKGENIIELPNNMVKGSIITIEFNHKNAKSPKSMNMSNDERVLGIGVKSIYLK